MSSNFDIIVLCAASERQAYAFRQQLTHLYTDIDVSKIRVYADKPDGVKIGMLFLFELTQHT
jgi:hypothetical protein